MRYKIRYSEYHLKIDDLTAAVQDAVRSQMKEAAKRFLKAAAKRIPVYSGRAKESLSEIADYLGVPWPVPRVESSKGRRLTAYNEGTFEPPRTTRDNVITQRGTRFILQIGTNVDYYEERDYHPLTAEQEKYMHLTGGANLATQVLPPWGSFDAGYAAAENYLARHRYDDMPKNIYDFTISTAIETE